MAGAALYCAADVVHWYCGAGSGGDDGGAARRARNLLGAADDDDESGGTCATVAAWMVLLLAGGVSDGAAFDSRYASSLWRHPLRACGARGACLMGQPSTAVYASSL